MKILIISNLYPPVVLGGYEILCGQVCGQFVQRGHVVHVLTSDFRTEGEPAGREPEVSGPTVQRLLKLYRDFGQSEAMDRPARRRVTLYNRRIAAEVIEQVKPDVIFVWSQLRLTLGAAQSAERSGVPTCYTFNDYHISGYAPVTFSLLPRRLARFIVERTLYRQITLNTLRLSRSTCISCCVKEELLRRGVRIENSEIIFQGIPIERFPCKENPGQIGSPVRLLYAGQLHEYKGVHTLLEAASIVSSGHPVRVTIAGAGDATYVDRLKQMAQASKLEVDFVGKLDHDEIGACYREHDIFVFPSIWPEPFGLTHLEAMASGTPVVSTCEGGHGEFLRNNVNSLTFPRENAACLAGCLSRLIQNPNDARRLAEVARAEVAVRFRLERYVVDLEAWLKNVAQDKP